jgi:hypothetical protein
LQPFTAGEGGKRGGGVLEKGIHSGERAWLGLFWRLDGMMAYMLSFEK